MHVPLRQEETLESGLAYMLIAEESRGLVGGSGGGTGLVGISFVVDRPLENGLTLSCFYPTLHVA